MTSSNTSNEKDLKYTCDFNVDLPDEPENGIDVIFRPISLSNPFPGIDGEGRNAGINWLSGSSDTNEIIEDVILNNRGVETVDVYTELDPLYKIVLTPTLIKKIRKYNNTTTYSDYNLECDSNGNNCKSKFIRERLNAGNYDFSEYFTGCGISGKSYGLDCGYNEAW